MSQEKFIDAKYNVAEISEFSNDHPLLEQILDHYGYGLHTFKVIFLTTLILMCEGFIMTTMGALIIPLTKYYSLSHMAVKIISSIIFCRSRHRKLLHRIYFK